MGKLNSNFLFAIFQKTIHGTLIHGQTSTKYANLGLFRHLCPTLVNTSNTDTTWASKEEERKQCLRIQLKGFYNNRLLYQWLSLVVRSIFYHWGNLSLMIFKYLWQNNIPNNIVLKSVFLKKILTNRFAHKIHKNCPNTS